MNKQQLFEEVATLLVQLFELDPDEITLESKLYEDLELDSIVAIDLIVQLQKKTDKSIKPDLFKTVRTVQDIVNAVEDLFNS